MNKLIILTLCCVLAACANTSKKHESKTDSTVPLTEQEKAYISQVEADGRRLYEKDIRAADATDLLLGKINPADFPNFVGWITYPNQEDYTVSFYEKNGESFSIIADVIYSAEEKVNVDLQPQRKPSEMEESMMRARIVALEKGTNSCSDRFNTVVMPSQNENEWDVYVLAATNDPKIMQVGGHVKVSVNKTTSAVTAITPLSKSCLAMDKSGADLPEGAKISAFTVSYIISPMPIAIHPYLNLLHDVNLVVASERGVWMLASGKIVLL